MKLNHIESQIYETKPKFNKIKKFHIYIKFFFESLITIIFIILIYI